ncbi:hypothetical protein [Nocardia gamkensis]|uniref:Uncharacterized protein n=1 Tax=Nocardia gamkensis TaxID=352869 RepID=A0A7X6R3Y4_9NOCA|nr:hypothetical protein [Nocardia gamkensis]NKY27742.1 hypothetical protein [Nocardia gamkensis]NQE67379.1 hypothetical protein [Nocardia gamkensis]
MNSDARKKIESYQEIDDLYRQDKLPTLEPDELAAIVAFLDEHRCENIGGAVLADDSAWPRDAVGTYRSNLIDRRKDTFKGPNIIQGIYYPNGIGIWTTGDIGDIR